FKNLAQVPWPRSHMMSGTEQGTESRLKSQASAVPLCVITVVFITLLTVLVVIIIYLYKNKGSYHTYEQPEADVSVQMENLPSKGEKEEYFI
uniref:Small cell adhesion glycoprotein n=1 Tax=Terrapene triunguis TaxID=2587831 RepID=A0A674J3M2_9SAUR